MKRPLTSNLVRTCFIRQAYPGVKPLAELELPPAVSAIDDTRPPFAPIARYLEDAAQGADTRFAAVLPGALYHPTANLLLAGRGKILLDTDNVWREFPETPVHQRYYWRDLYLKRTRRMRGATLHLRSQANNFYHTLVDNLPRLYWLHQPALRGVPVSVLIPGGLRTWEPYFLERLLPETARVIPVATDCLWRSDEPIFGSYLSRILSGHLPREYLDFFLPRVLPQRKRDKRHRIYITRRTAPGGRRITNEPAVVALLELFGFQPHALETLSLPEQIELFYDAEAVVAPHGAGLTNMLFADSLDVVELHPASTVMPHYYLMARSLGHRYSHLCANQPDRHSSFEVDLSTLESLLRNTFSHSQGATPCA